MKEAKLKYTLLALVLRQWQEEGYSLGTRQALQLQELLRQLPADATPEQLRNFLAALLVKSDQEQLRFYAIFENALKQAQEICAEKVPEEGLDEEEDDAIEEAEKGIQFWWVLIIVFSILLLIGLIAWGIWMTQPVSEKERQAPRVERLVLNQGDTLTLNLHKKDTARLLLAEPNDFIETPKGNGFFMDSSGLAQYFALESSPFDVVDSVLAQLHYYEGIDSVFLLVSLRKPPEPPPPPDSNRISLIPLPYPEDIGRLVISAETQQQYELFRQYEWPLKIALMLLLGALAWAILRWDQYRRAKVIAEIRNADKAPYIWNPAKKQKELHWLKDVANPLLRRFRGRAVDERQRLDIKATIRETSRKAGRIQFVYKSRTLPPDYLLLIDRYTANDHQAKLYDALYQVMEEAEVPVSRYFYYGDPRICYNDAFPEGITLAELLHRHTGARLLIVGEGLGFLSPATGRLAPWTKLIADRQHKTLFSPRPRTSWGLQEQELAALMPVMPASLQGIQVAIEAFLSEEAPTQDEMLEQVKDALLSPVAFEGNLLKDLRRHYSEPMLKWIAACAIWPTLSWDLTLFLGEKLSELLEVPLVAFNQMRSLNRLPWFSQGRIPERAREILLDFLAAEKLESPMRLAIQDMLGQGEPPPADSVAYEDYRMNVILNELMLKPDPATRRRLEREFALYIAAGKKPDFVAFRLLDRPGNRLDVLVGRRLKKFAFREGLPGLGWKLGPKLIAIWMVLATALFFISPNLDPCDGQLVEYEGESLCLSDARDSLLYLEHLAKDAISVQKHNRVDSLRLQADALVLEDSAFYLNTAARYFNYGAKAYNCSLDSMEECAYSLPLDSLPALACRNFKYGKVLWDSIHSVPAVDFLLAQRLACIDAIASPEDSIETPALPATFNVSGLVLDAMNDQPVANAVVRMADAAKVSAQQIGQGQNTDILEAQTDNRGNFSLNEVPLAGRLLLYVQATDYELFQQQISSSSNLPTVRLQPGISLRDTRAWEVTQTTNTPQAYQDYLRQFPNGIYVAEANARIEAAATTRENETWQTAQGNNTIEDYQAYLDNYPSGAYSTEAQQRIDELQSAQQDDEDWEAAQAQNTPEACRDYLNKWPNGRHKEAAEACAKPPAAAYLKPEMIRIPAGTFEMGDVMEDQEHDDEKPIHEVTLNAYYIGQYEVTFAEYDAFCEATGKEKPNDEGWGRNNRPVINVSWFDVVEYCNWLSEQEGFRPVYTINGEEVTANWQANGYRLPTEAEWEYAARQGGQKVRFGNGKDIADPKEINFNGSESYKKPYSLVGEYRRQTVPVGSLNSPNQLGLHDMSGNVYEWCWDWYGDYGKEAQTNPRGPVKGSIRVFRGGSWFNFPQYCRAALRGNFNPAYRDYYLGFRLARS